MPAAIMKVQKRPSVPSKVLLLSLTNSRFEIIRRRKRLIAPNRREIRRGFFSNLHLPKLLLINDKVKGSLLYIDRFHLYYKFEFYFLCINLITSQMQSASPAIMVMIEASGPKRPPVNSSGPEVTDSRILYSGIPPETGHPATVP